MSVILGKVTSVNLGGTDLSPYLADAGFELSPWQESLLDALPDASQSLNFRSMWNTPRSLTFVGTLDAAAQAYFAALFEARRRRLSRMRAAYRARRR